MLPTRWDGKDIVVLDQVVVKGPGYRSEDCRAGKEAGSALARVKKVVSKNFCSQDMNAVFATWLLLWLKIANKVKTYSSRTNARNWRSASRRDPSPSSRRYLPFQLFPEDPGRGDDLSPIQHQIGSNEGL